jgi:NAD(P)-dependent dehydrogenase (short-subunit alcohol dehydrogenase family)
MDKIALVTGAGSGIGRASALALCDAGFTVVLAGRRKETLEQTAAKAVAGKTCVHVADVSDEASVEELFEEVRKRYGRLDLLFNNAGVFGKAVPFEETPTDSWEEAVSINLTGSFLCARAAYRMMKDQKPQGGRIINNGSIAAHAPRPHTVSYAATKHAITGLTKLISIEGRKYDIACGQIDIGNAATDILDQLQDPTPSRRRGGMLQADGTLKMEAQMDVKHAAGAVVYMASLPLDANVQFLTVMATKMPWLGRA